MCASTGAVFGWVGTILVNIGFISLISWGAATMWPLGFVLSAVYTVFLFWLADWLEQRQYHYENLPLEQSLLEDDDEEQSEAQRSSITSHTTEMNLSPVLISLLYGLSILSLGVTGFFLPVNLFPPCDSADSNRPQWTWTTNVTSLPKGVRRWADNPDMAMGNTASFGYISSTDTTLFSGWSLHESSPCLWSIHASTNNADGGILRHAPQKQRLYQSPQHFTTLSNHTVCFQSHKEHPFHGPQRHIHCSDGKTFRPAVDPTGQSHQTAFDLFPLDGILWFKEFPTRSLELGQLVYSLDPESMLLSLHSQRVRPNDWRESGSSCRDTVRKQAIATLFFTALPITMASFALWNTKHVSSMGTTAYVGLTLVFASCVAAIDPDLTSGSPLKWWFSVTGGLWLLVLSYYFILSESNDDDDYKGPLRWGMVTGGIAFPSGMISLLLFNGNDELWRWILVNVLAFIPLILLGAATDTVFLMFLGACGFLVDSWRFAFFVGHLVKSEASAPMHFLVFSLTGLMVGAIGTQLSKHKHRVKEWALGCLQSSSPSLTTSREGPVLEPDDSTSALLQSSTGNH